MINKAKRKCRRAKQNDVIKTIIMVVMKVKMVMMIGIVMVGIGTKSLVNK